MNTVNAFGHTIHITHCEHTEYYTNSDLQYSVERIFDLPEIKNRARGADWDSHYGEGETSEIIPSLGPANIPGADLLTNWVIEQCGQVLGKSVVVDRSWMNRLNTGSQGRCHRHVGVDRPGMQQTPDLVAIFYVNNPPGGSSLVIVDHGIAGQLPSDMTESNKYYICPNTGDLVMHGPDVWHAVSEHLAVEPRICFVYQVLTDN
jgi:hypothetical protein